MEQFAIGANFKCAAARWDERERFDAFAEFKYLGRQTDGLGRVVSDDAIFDRDLHLHSAWLLSDKRVRKSAKAVKMRAAQADWRSRGLKNSSRVYKRKAAAGRMPATALLNPFQIC